MIFESIGTFGFHFRVEPRKLNVVFSSNGKSDFLLCVNLTVKLVLYSTSLHRVENRRSFRPDATFLLL
jgi:hypothetical protein